MNKSMEEEVKLTKEDYNNIPVYFCKDCLSLKIMNGDWYEGVLYEDNCGIDFCDNCGSTDIIEAPIEIWQRLYLEKYGKLYK